MDGGRLSKPWHCSNGVQAVPKDVYHSGCHGKHNWLLIVGCDRWISHNDILQLRMSALCITCYLDRSGSWEEHSARQRWSSHCCDCWWKRHWWPCSCWRCRRPAWRNWGWRHSRHRHHRNNPCHAIQQQST